MKQIAIVVVHFNSDEETKDCLNSLKRIEQKGFQVQVVVVDNGSKLPLEIPAHELAKNVTIIRSDANLGFTAGNNWGIQYAFEHFPTDYVLLLNNDTTVEKHFLNHLFACLKDESVGMVVPKIYFTAGREFHHDQYRSDERGKVIWYGGGSVDWQHFVAFHRGVDEVDRGQFDHQTQTDFATGCCVLIPRTIIEKVGVLDQKYFLYLEDVDWSLRVRAAGYKIRFCPEAVVWHKNAGSSGGSGSRLHQYYQTRNRLFFFWRYLRLPRLIEIPASLVFEGDASTQLVPNSFFHQIYDYLTLLRYAVHLFLTGTNTERRGIFDWTISRMGKQPIL
jgi:GT2 family glycosyltransferase